MMFKIELWDKTYETPTKDYTFRTIIEPIKLGILPYDKSHVWQLGVGLFDISHREDVLIKSPKVYSPQEYDALMAYAKCKIQSAVKINEPPRWGVGDLKLNRLNPALPPVKANQKWIKTPERLLQVDKIDHIRNRPIKEGGGTVFVMNYCENLVEPDLPFEEACRLLGYIDE